MARRKQRREKCRLGRVPASSARKGRSCWDLSQPTLLPNALGGFAFVHAGGTQQAVFFEWGCEELQTDRKFGTLRFGEAAR